MNGLLMNGVLQRGLTVGEKAALFLFKIDGEILLTEHGVHRFGDRVIVSGISRILKEQCVKFFRRRVFFDRIGGRAGLARCNTLEEGSSSGYNVFFLVRKQLADSFSRINARKVADFSGKKR